jgi:hypothetical protein
MTNQLNKYGTNFVDVFVFANRLLKLAAKLGVELNDHVQTVGE